MFGNAPKVDRSPLPAAPTLEDPAVEKARADAIAENKRQASAATAILAQNVSPLTATNDNIANPAVRRLLGAA